jgi:hypothetical protein
MDAQVSYWLSLPDDVLMNNVFTQLSFPYLTYLCQVNERFAKICRNDYLWHKLTERDFGITSMPQGINSWRETYLLYKVLNEPKFAVPYVENAIVELGTKRSNSPFNQYVFNKYRPAIDEVTFTDRNGNTVQGIINRVALYNLKTNTIERAKSLDQVKIILFGEGGWRNVRQDEVEGIEYSLHLKGKGPVFEPAVRGMTGTLGLPGNLLNQINLPAVGGINSPALDGMMMPTVGGINPPVGMYPSGGIILPTVGGISPPVGGMYPSGGIILPTVGGMQQGIQL